jgi:hypothetical protein
MRAMVINAPRTPLRATERDLPRPGPEQVLIRVHACGFCRTDWHVVDGELTDPRLPIIPRATSPNQITPSSQEIPGDADGHGHTINPRGIQDPFNAIKGGAAHGPQLIANLRRAHVRFVQEGRTRLGCGESFLRSGFGMGGPEKKKSPRAVIFVFGRGNHAAPIRLNAGGSGTLRISGGNHTRGHDGEKVHYHRILLGGPSQICCRGKMADTEICCRPCLPENAYRGARAPR